MKIKNEIQEVTRGAVNAQRREGAPRSTRAFERIPEIERTGMIGSRKKSAQIVDTLGDLSGPGPAGNFKFFYSMFDKSAVRVHLLLLLLLLLLLA